MSPSGTRVTMTYSHPVDAPPAEVFPLLCPIREDEWIPGWHGEAIYSESGVAEPDGIFSAGLEGSAKATFFVLRHEPPRTIDYLVLGTPGIADRLALTLEESAAGTTTLTWRRTYTGLDADGCARVASAAAAFEARVPKLAELLNAHVRRAR